MLLKVLLWALNKRIEWLSENDETFQKSIARKVCVLQFRTYDNRIARYFSFRSGKPTSNPAVHDNPSLTFIFEDNRAVRQLITAMAKDPSDKGIFMNAMKKGKVRIEGDVSLLAWFMGISERFGPDMSAS